MMRIKFYLLVYACIVFLIFGMSASVFSQVSLVPATHSVYDWLSYQRASGLILDYNHEDLPINRGKIVDFLKKIEENRIELSLSDKATLDAYQQEFDPEFLIKSVENGLFTSDSNVKERLKYFFTSKDEPHLFAIYDSISNTNGAFDIQFGRAEINAWENGEWRWARYKYKGVRLYTTVQGNYGAHIEVDNVSSLGDDRLLLVDPKWGTAQKLLKDKATSSYSYETMATIEGKYLSADIGRGSLKIGPGASSSLILNIDAPNFNWLRLKLDSKFIDYTAIHGSLYAEPYETTVQYGDISARSRVSPNRFISLHRISLRPAKRVKLSFTEYIIYSNTDMDIGKLNPISPLIFTELDGGDKNNLLISGDLVINPIDRVEVYGSVLVDDLVSWKFLFKDTGDFDNDVAYNYGTNISLPYSILFSTGFTRIQPFVYTHWQQLNTVEQRKIGLGHEAGPNSETLEFSVKKWLPYRSRVSLSFKKVKKGFNPIDANGNVSENVGGDINLGSDGPFQPGYTMFENADVNTWNQLEMEFQIEPWRGVILNARLIDRKMTQGARLSNFRYIDLRVRLGF
ncbi:MAG: hypothetical protein ABJR05_10140 [Balneola sp.]